MKKALLGIAALLAATSANASIIPELVRIDPDGNAFRYVYNVTITPETGLVSGDKFTIFDFGGFIPGSNIQPENFAFAFQFSGPDHFNQNVTTDSATVPNLTWTYTGSPYNMDPSDPDSLNLGEFTVLSTFNLPTVSVSSGEWTNNSGDEAGQPGGNSEPVRVPVPNPPLSEVPEPGMLGLLGLGVLGLAAARRRKVA